MMSEDVLDDELRFDGFKRATTFYVDSEDWIMFCNDLENKTIFKSIFIIVGAAIFSMLILGMLSIYIAIFFIVLILVRFRRKFKKLRALANHYFIIDSTKIEHHSNSFHKTYAFSEILDISFFTWGIEIEVKDRRGGEKILVIPCMIEGYGQLTEVFYRLKRS